MILPKLHQIWSLDTSSTKLSLWSTLLVERNPFFVNICLYYVHSIIDLKFLYNKIILLCIVDYESLKSMHNAFDSQNKSKDPMIYIWYNTCMCNLFGHICFKCTFWFRRKYSQILIRLIFIYRVCAQNIWISISLQREFCECTL